MPNRPGGFLYADDDVLRGVTLALRQVDRDARKEWARAVRTDGRRVWRSALSKRQTLPQDRIFGTASVSWTMAGKGTAKVKVRPLSGTLGDGDATTPRDRDWALIDFGTKQQRSTVAAHTRKGVKVRQFDRRTTLPRQVQQGRVVYGALDPFGRWLGQMALATAADLIRQATNGD